MSNPEKETATQQPEAVDVSKQVSSVVSKITTDEEGNYVFPEDIELTPELKFAATAEKRRRDTQAAFTKSQQTLKALEAEKAKLLELAQGTKTLDLTPEQQEELDTLKYEDPEAWRKKVNSLETEAKKSAEARIAELTGEAKQAAEREFELQRRQQVLAEFNASASTPITDEIIANEVPPRITKRLESGDISFEEFLSEVDTYLNTGKVVKNEEVLGQPNLSTTVGGQTPANYKPEPALVDSYRNDIY